MKKDFMNELEVPEGIEVAIDGKIFKFKGPNGEITREFKLKGIKIEKKDNKIILSMKNASKNDKRAINTTKAHLKNMIHGAKEGFEYKLKICFSHFPMTVEIKDNKAIIKNFLGERVPRIVDLPKDADIKVDKEYIIVKSIDKESAGNAAAKFELSTKVGKRDRRIFQDGIFIISKAGRDI